MSRPTAQHPLLILAMDHRDSFARLFGATEGQESGDQVAQLRTAKWLVYQGLRRAADKLTAGAAGVLVDLEYGARVLDDARAAGLVVAMPVEKSGQRLFTLEYGAQTAARIAEHEPAYVKVLVRMNPDDDPDDTQTQLRALADLSDRLRRAGRAFLYELLVPPTDAQLAAGGQSGYDREVRPDLVARVIAANQQAGVEPALWKVEGLETAEAARHVVSAAKADGRDADCVVLGRDASRPVLDHWLSVAAGVPGFVGFAVGRSIWEDAVTRHRGDGDDDRLIDAVATEYLHFARTYLDQR
jgi:myo-inositol catabolism protein IolC